MVVFLSWSGVASATSQASLPAGPAGAGGARSSASSLALLVMAYSLLLGKATVLAISGAHQADPAQYLQLHNLVETLALGAGLPKPQVYVIDDPAPNAFATGLRPGSAAITVTTGLLQMMNREELEGVLGHEMSHIRNHDVRVVLIVATMVGLRRALASLLWRSMFSLAACRRARYSPGTDRRRAALTVVGLVVGAVDAAGPLALRESLADASSVELTGNPLGLAPRASRKIAQNDKPLENQPATTAMFIDNPLEHHESWHHRPL